MNLISEYYNIPRASIDLLILYIYLLKTDYIVMKNDESIVIVR